MLQPARRPGEARLPVQQVVGVVLGALAGPDEHRLAVLAGHAQRGAEGPGPAARPGEAQQVLGFVAGLLVVFAGGIHAQQLGRAQQGQRVARAGQPGQVALP